MTGLPFSPPPTARPRAATTAEAAVDALAPNASERLWRRVNLVYLIFLFLPLVFGPRTTAVDVAATLVALALFLPVYWNSYAWGDRKALYAALGMIALGFALSPWNPGGNTFVVYAFATLGFSQPWRRAVLVAALTVAAYAAYLPAVGQPAAFAFAPLVIGGAVLTGAIYARREMDHNARLRLTQQEVERLARSTERERIARDLHDLLGHTLSVIAVKSELARKLAERDGSQAAGHIAEVEQVAREALTQVREAVSGMRSAELSAELANARLSLLSAGIALDVRCDPLPPLEPAQENALGMALREAVTNVIRHAGARRVDIDLVREGRLLRLDVQDDGRGVAGAPGNGLTGMRERLEGLGGGVRLDAAPGAGTRLRVLLPLDAPPPRG
jgi:two-component system sensor histidine kinase DesK